MRIALIAPLFETVPPRGYGGIERVVASLCDGLTERGHLVTLFASAGSRTAAQLVPGSNAPLREYMTPGELQETAPHLHLAMISEVYRRADDFDVIHSHVEPYTFPFADLVDTPTVITAHGTLEPPIVAEILGRYPRIRLVSISRAQRMPLRSLSVKWAGNVYNGVPVEDYSFRTQHGDYLAFLGRITPAKRPDRAIEVARRARLPLKVGAKIDPSDQIYWEEEIGPLFAANDVEFLGEVDDAAKVELLSGAYATLMPIDWAEPFGLAMVESLACGTPVIALRRGSVPEIIDDGRTGWICNTVDDMVAAIPRVRELDRAQCRQAALRFDVSTMVRGYESVYRSAIHGAAHFIA